MMAKYEVEVLRTYRHVVNVTATSPSDAMRQAADAVARRRIEQGEGAAICSMSLNMQGKENGNGH